MTVNNTGLELTKAAELHGHAFVADTFYEEVVNGKNRRERSVEFQKVLENLLELHLLNTFFRHMGDVLRVSFCIFLIWRKLCLIKQTKFPFRRMYRRITVCNYMVYWLLD